ncbi:MAG: RIP metalloprotease RseP [Eubacteriales bacterium]|nr:RIP metalloprotease RseP [Eubacteriales bacterium]
MIINVLLAILVLSVVVLIHEFGHFIIAKANGVTVVEFSLGFGPRLLHIKKGETIYSIKMLPFGGSCMMLGEEFMEIDHSDEINEQERGLSEEERLAIEAHRSEKSFSNKSVWARIAIIAAGPLFNFLLALVLAIVIIGSVGYDPCTVDVVYDNSPAVEAGLREGDLITKINGEAINFQREYSFIRSYHAKDTMNITYERDGQKYTTTLTPQFRKESSYRIGITVASNGAVSSVSENSPAEDGGLKKGDVIQSINGNAMEGSTQIIETISNAKGESLKIVVSRDGTKAELMVTPELVESEGYYTGFAAYGQRIKAAPVNTIKYSFNEVGYWIKTVIKSLGMMFTGQLGVNDLSGPVGAVNIMSNVVEESKADGSFYVFLNLLNLGVMISANLGVMNLLPLPAIDGGRLVFLLIEAVRGKPVKKEREGMIHFIGMILLMLLMVYIMFKDIKGLF